MENSPTTKKSVSLDWLVRGTLTKLGETFDRLTGRNWKPASNLATSELVERLKKLLDAQARMSADKSGRFVPHNIKLLMQWDKFSVDGSEISLQKLENELLVAAVDHINDRRYQTYAPLKFEIKQDYFTEDVKLETSFGEFAPEIEGGDEPEAAPVNVPVVANLKHIVPKTVEVEEEKLIAEPAPQPEIFTARYMANGQPRDVRLAFGEKARLSVGRSRDNALWIDDASVSKIHASLVLGAEKQLSVADTGSTNGTFVNGERIAYGKAIAVGDNGKIKFGTIEVEFDRQESQSASEQFEPNESVTEAENIKSGDGKMSINLSEL